MFHTAPRAGALISIVAVLGMVVAAPPAQGHAALTGSEPEAGEQLSSPPGTVTVSYAEPPTQSSQFAVMDGCDRDVTESVEILNDTIEATTAEAQPGKWTVSWSVVSAVDGHLTRDKVGFTVDGEPDCSAAGPDVQTDDREEPASSVPVVPIAIATAAILALAVGLRVMSRPKGDR